MSLRVVFLFVSEFDITKGETVDLIFRCLKVVKRGNLMYTEVVGKPVYRRTG